MQFYLTFAGGVFLKAVFCCILILCFAFILFGQNPSVVPTPPPDEPIKISTEEVHLNVTAQSSSASGKFIPTLTAADLLVVEEGDPQTVTSMKKIPANVLLLLDTGSELNFVKRISTTRLIAQLFVASLGRENTLAVMQYYNKIELLNDWTNDFEAVSKTLDTKLFSGKRIRFTDAINAAVEAFSRQPLENRHLVLITDGLENVAGAPARQKAIENLLAANITVHVLSYTTMEEQSARKASERFRIGDGKTKPRIDPLIWDDIVRGLPVGVDRASAAKIREQLRMLNESQSLFIIDLDNERRKLVRQKSEEWHESQISLQALAEDTGGMFGAPEELPTLFRSAIQTANAIDSNYVITYIPTKTVADSSKFAPRKVRVSSHLNGVIIRSRQRVIWSAPPPP